MNVSYWMALTNGILAFLSPCILPMLPVYFAYLAGEAVSEIEEPKIKSRMMQNAMGFVLGVTLLNVLLGFGANALISRLSAYQSQLRIAGGILMMLFGLYFVFGLKWMFIEKERKVHLKRFTPNFFKSFLLGITFSFGWTPCNGPLITSILIVSSFQKDYFRAGSLMLTYSLGFSVLFLVSAFLMSHFVKRYRKIFPYFGVIKIISGALMFIMGILLIMNKIYILNPS